MNISCKIAEDLLPLYLDNSCSGDSRAAIEEHLKDCPSCRMKLNRMQSDITGEIHPEQSAPKLANYAKKVRRHRVRVAVFVVVVSILSSAALALGYLTVRDMYRQTSPVVFGVEPGTYNLITNDLETTAEEIGQYVFFTNYSQIKVTVQSNDNFQGTVMLWNTANSNSFIQIHDVSERAASCTFTGLSASNRYQITCDNLDGAKITVSEGRTISFWHSLGSVLSDIIGTVGG